MQQLLLFILIILFSLVEFSHPIWPCKIRVKVRNSSMQKVKAQLFVPALKVKSDQMVFEPNGNAKKVKIIGDNCMEKPWQVKTWSWNDDGRYWTPAKNLTAKITGNGYISIYIMPDLKPVVVDKRGVLCVGEECGVT